MASEIIQTTFVGLFALLTSIIFVLMVVNLLAYFIENSPKLLNTAITLILGSVVCYVIGYGILDIL